jgi:protein O-GlcNAc transferase
MLYQALPFIARHDKERFRVIGYSAARECPVAAKGLDAFRWVGLLSDAEFGRKVRSDGVDILVELTGFTPGHRFAAMAARLAPVQINYINHNGTTGTPNIDWTLADHIAAPAGIDGQYSEGLWRLDGCFTCFDYGEEGETPPPAPPPSSTRGFVTFGCYGNAVKINDELTALWAEILRRVPGSRLRLRNASLSSDINRDVFQKRFARHGIAAERLSLLPGASRHEILRDHAEIDISLDTWPYCGGNTIAESLHQGVPVVTLRGERFASAYGASILSASGCAELIAADFSDYVDKAAALAASPERLSFYRANLRRLMAEHGFSDSRGFARRLERAYEEMLDRTTGARRK